MNAGVRHLAILLLALCPSWLAAQNDGIRLFKSNCALCHAEDGSGNTPSGKALEAKDLRSRKTQSKSDAEIADLIAQGRNKMPGFAQNLKPDQIQQLVAYIRHLAKK
ncbi:MAG: cytochrome c [Acidobacteria bacterium]|nr:cytochrome c [Acidobacteriota bacterium]